MPLPDPETRTRLHERRLSIDGYQREDGLFDIEGHLVDTKTYDFDSQWRGKVEAGVPVHEMWLRLTIDTSLTIRAVAAELDYGPFQPCHEVAPNFSAWRACASAPAGWARCANGSAGPRAAPTSTKCWPRSPPPPTRR